MCYIYSTSPKKKEVFMYCKQVYKNKFKKFTVGQIVSADGTNRKERLAAENTTSSYC